MKNKLTVLTVSKNLNLTFYSGLMKILSNSFSYIKNNLYFICICIILLALGFYEFQNKLKPSNLGTFRYRKHGLYNFIRSLPGRPMIAVHPHLGSEIPLMSGKSVLISKESSHPWWTEYWKIIFERTQDFFRTYYSTDKNQIINFIEKYKIDYLIIRHKDFKKSYLKRRKFYMQPFNKWIRNNLKPSTESLLNHIPKNYLMYEDRKYIVVSSKDLIKWLEGRT